MLEVLCLPSAEPTAWVADMWLVLYSNTSWAGWEVVGPKSSTMVEDQHWEVWEAEEECLCRSRRDWSLSMTVVVVEVRSLGLTSGHRHSAGTVLELTCSLKCRGVCVRCSPDLLN